MKLVKMEIKNFKGINDLTVNFSDEITIIQGDNEVGKTTIYDAYIYAITGKDSLGNQNNELLIPTNLSIVTSPEVKLTFNFRGVPITIYRTYKAKTNRAKEYTGKYETQVEINGVPKNVSDIQDYFERIMINTSKNIDIPAYELFKMCTDPLYFLEKITPQKGESVSDKQKSILSVLCNIDNDFELSSKNPRFVDIIDDLKQHFFVEDLIKSIKHSMSRLNKEIDDFPIKIKQQSKNFLEVISDETTEKNKLYNLESKKLEIENEMYELMQDDELIWINKSIDEVEIEINNIEKANENFKCKQKYDYEKSLLVKTFDLKERKTSIESKREKEINVVTRNREKIENTISIHRKSINQNKKDLEDAEQALKAEVEKTELVSIACPACFREYEEKDIKKAYKDIQNEKESKIKCFKGKICNFKKNIRTEENNISKLEIALNELVLPDYSSYIIEIENEISRLEMNEGKCPNEDMDTFALMVRELKQKKEQLENKKSDMINSKQQIKVSLGEKIEEVKSEIDIVKKEIQKHEFNSNCQKLIDELKTSNLEKLKIKDGLQNKLDIANDFYVYRCKKMSDNLDKYFDGIAFKFVKFTKENNDPVPCCIIEYNGRSYEVLSKSTKIICGAKISDGFQKFSKIKFPIFVDDSEGIFADLKLECQLIKLIAAEEFCPVCTMKSGRRQKNGFWTCESCRTEWKKEMRIL